MDYAISFTVVLTLYVTIVTSNVGARSRKLDDIANPVIDPPLCGRAKSSYVCDPDQVLTSAQADELDQTLADIRNATVCPCSVEHACRTESHGYIIGVAVINKISISDSDVSETVVTSSDSNYVHAMKLNALLKEARTLSHDLLLKWKLGHCEDDVLILFSASDNVLYTAVDSTSRRVLTDDLVGEISSNVRLELSKNQTSGLNKLLLSYKSVLLGTYQRTTNWDRKLDPQAVVSGAAALPTSLLPTQLLLLSAATLGAASLVHRLLTATSAPL